MERLVEISGRSRSLYLRNITKKYSYDVGRLLEGNEAEAELFAEHLWQRRRKPYKLICDENRKGVVRNLKDRITVRGGGADELVRQELASVLYLKREIEEIEKETGRYELFVGYPFVRGWMGDTAVRAPLLLFPARLIADGQSAEIEFVHAQPVQFNKVFLLAYAQEYGLNLEGMVQDFDDMGADPVKTVAAAVNYLKGFGFKLRMGRRSEGFCVFEESDPRAGDNMEVCGFAVLGRYPLANSIYNDYVALERGKLSNNAIDALLAGRAEKKGGKTENAYLIDRLDYSQEKVIEKVNGGGNLVVYGPPGTGKSQTIVNIVADAVCKGKRVLVVSQKRAALDVVYNRLGTLNKKAVLIPDPDKGKAQFYADALAAHAELMQRAPDSDAAKYNASVTGMRGGLAELEGISRTLNTPAEFGIPLSQMYAESYIIGKESRDYPLYEAILNNKKLLKYKYPELSGLLREIAEKNKGKLYIDYLETRRQNPLADHIATNLDIQRLNEAKTFVDSAIAKTYRPFDSANYPHSRYILTYYLEHKDNDKYALKQYAGLVAKLENPKLARLRAAARFPLLWPLLLYTVPKFRAARAAILKDFDAAIGALRRYVEEFALLRLILDNSGFAMTLDAIANGNSAYLRKLRDALDDYVYLRDARKNLAELTVAEREILDFVKENSGSRKEFLENLNKILPVRVYIEALKEEKERKNELSKLMLFEDIRERILALKGEQHGMVRGMAFEKASAEYLRYYKEMDAPERAGSDGSSKNFLYQIGKHRGFWPIRKLMDYFDGFMLRLYPCWLLSPETVSTILPLKKEMFDLILFDEASQVYIESTIPALYRGKNIVVAGDNKQLRPTASFVKRYLGSDDAEGATLSEQAALEVESLLDLATARYEPANLTYHYRSRYEELINFSNYAFYEGRLQIAPNVEKKTQKPPIERVMVKGSWQNRRNQEEAEAVVDLVKRIFRNRTQNETIGIVTFNIEQKEYIEDLLDREALKNAQFKKPYYAERNRVENGEDISLFVKNLENVQGDERDIIIFSVGYARNSDDKIFAHFGSLSVEGGENRLNVAITRAKQKIYIVTSVEPEELAVDGAKNAGPKLLKRYLQYARAVSNNDQKEVRAILGSLCARSGANAGGEAGLVEARLKDELTKLGYKVDTALGNADYKLSLGVYEEKSGKYILGVECDYAAYKSSNSVLERDVYRPEFLRSRGWHIVRVWSRDWWLTPGKVVSGIDRTAKVLKKKVLTDDK